jgi:hypothetical protein
LGGVPDRAGLAPSAAVDHLHRTEEARMRYMLYVHGFIQGACVASIVFWLWLRTGIREMQQLNAQMKKLIAERIAEERRSVQ